MSGTQSPNRGEGEQQQDTRTNAPNRARVARQREVDVTTLTDEWNQMQPQAEKFFQAARQAQYAHHAHAKLIQESNKNWSNLSAFLASVSGASIITHLESYPDFVHCKAAVEIIQGALALAAAVITKTHSAHEMATLVEKHRHAANKYGAFRRHIRTIYFYPVHLRPSLTHAFDEFEKQLIVLADSSPQITDDEIWDTVCAQLRRDPSPMMSGRDDEPSP